MTAPLLLGLDLGGSGVRCLLASADGKSRVASYRAYPMAANGDDASPDLDLAALWRGVISAVNEALERSAATPDSIHGIAATGMRFGTLVIGDDGQSVLAASNRDARAIGEAIGLAGEHGEALLAMSGHWPTPLIGASRLRWLEAQGFDLARARVIATPSDWLTHQLCGEWATDASQAAGTGLVDLTTRDWSNEWIDRLGIPSVALPRITAAGERVGSLCDAAATALGLPKGIPVSVAGADTQCAGLGAGALDAGTRFAACGTTLPIQHICDAPPSEMDGHLGWEPYAAEDRWVVESNGGLAGEALDWLGSLLTPNSSRPGASVLGLAETSQPGGRGVMARLGGEPLSARDLAVPLASLHFSTVLGKPADVPSNWSRAACENIAYGLRANLEALDAGGFTSNTPLRLAGGMTRSHFWNDLVANVIGEPVEVSASSETSALGAAICAGVGAGVFSGLTAGADAVADERITVTPSNELGERYAVLYERFREHGRSLEAARPTAQHHSIEALLSAGTKTAPLCEPLTDRPRILVTADLDPESLAALEAIGQVEYAPFRELSRLLTGPDLISALRGVQIFITEIDVVDADALAQAPDLRVIATCRGDAVNVDVEAAALHGIPVLHAPGRNAEAVADLTLAFLLALLRRLPEANAFLRDPSVEAGDLGKMGHAFGSLRGHELGGKTIGLVGLGAVGRAVARRLQGFGSAVLVHDPFVEPGRIWQLGLEPVSFEELLARSDAVSLHAAVTDESRGLFNADAFSKLRPGACFVNTARAALVDEDALLAALETGTLGGAAIDVFQLEPPGAEHPLLAFDRVIATPHLGGNTFEIGAHQGRIIAADLTALVAGNRPKHALAPEVWDNFAWSSARPLPSASALAELASNPGPAVTDLQKAPSLSSPESRTGVREAAAGMEEAGEKFERVLVAFGRHLEADEALNTFAKTRHVTLFFELTDLPLVFCIRCLSKGVEAGLAELQPNPTVLLRMRAATLDGMFTGRINPMQEAMGGGIAFTGDAAMAMTIQHIKADLERCYQAARDEVGDPGDLTPREVAAVAPVAAGDALRESLVRVVGDLYEQSLITATGGNVSARIPDSGDLWITPSQLFKGDLTEASLIRIGIDGELRDRTAAAPSSERMMHCAAYRAKPEAQAVIHAHAPHATILANAELPFLPISTEAAFFGDIPRIPFIMPGTDALAAAIEEALADGWAVLMKNHGLLVAGRSLRRAADMAEIIDRSAEIMLGCWGVGRQPPVLPDDVIEELRKIGDLVA